MRRVVQLINTASTGAISGTTITGGTPIPLNFNNVAVGIGLVAEVTGTVNYTLYHTYDDVFNSSITPVWLPHSVANMVGATSTQESNFVIPVSACQLILNSGSGSINFVLLQQGII